MKNKLKIVGLVGSYRKGHMIDEAVSAVLAGAEIAGAQIEKIYLMDKHIEFCTNCRKCTQLPGEKRQQCIYEQRDEMAELLDKLKKADGIVFGSAVNFFNVTAVTQRFIERLIVHVYWPWGKATPEMRSNQFNKKMVIVTSSAAPGILAKLFMHQPKKIMKSAGKLLGAKTIARIHFGLAGRIENQRLTARQVSRAESAGKVLVRKLQTK